MEKISAKWKILYTYPSYERKVYKELTRKGIQSYLPLYLVKTKWSDRIKLLERPFFPNYLFVNPDDVWKYEVLNTIGVVKYLSFDGREATISEQEITTIQQLLGHQHRLLTNDQAEIDGMSIVVLNGVLTGFRGSIVRRLNASFIEVFFESLGSLISIDTRKNMIASALSHNP
jgi:transcription antitermination factor NusG